MSYQMIDDVAHFTDKFVKEYKRDKSEAMIAFLSCFWTCYAIMEPKDRQFCNYLMGGLIKHIDSECFEDVANFGSFLKDNPLQ